MNTLKIAGFVPFTMIDYPNYLSAVIFLQGCPWRCRYCHNPDLIPPAAKSTHYQWNDILDFLVTRQGLLDGVVFSGGEPTLQSALIQAMTDVKRLGFLIGLHTSGAYPKKLVRLLPLLDWVGLDIKTLPNAYFNITKVRDSGIPAWESLRLLLAAHVPFECRTTLHTSLLSTETLLVLGMKLASLKVSHYAIQKCRPQHCLDSTLYNDQTSGHLHHYDAVFNRLQKAFPYFCVRE